MNKKIWLLWFLGALGVFGIYEAIAIFDNNEETIALTTAIVNNVNPYWFFGILALFLIWFIHHMIYWYRRFGKFGRKKD